MTIAFLSDIHGNLPALQSALEVARRAGAERLVVAGDLVGEGPHPVEVVRELRERGAEAIRGNVDRKVLKLGADAGKLERRLHRKGRQRRNQAWAALQLAHAPEERGWLADLPDQLNLEIGGRQVLVVHGSPWSDTDYVYPSLTPDGLRAKLEPLGGWRPAVLVCGHSHIPFAREVDGTVVLNCGSVGRPADGDPRGSLAILEVDGAAALRGGIARFHYDVEETAAALRERRVPGLDVDELRRGIKS